MLDEIPVIKQKEPRQANSPQRESSKRVSKETPKKSKAEQSTGPGTYTSPEKSPSHKADNIDRKLDQIGNDMREDVINDPVEQQNKRSLRPNKR